MILDSEIGSNYAGSPIPHHMIIPSNKIQCGEVDIFPLPPQKQKGLEAEIELP